jgi:hypothetical protein
LDSDKLIKVEWTNAARTSVVCEMAMDQALVFTSLLPGDERSVLVSRARVIDGSLVVDKVLLEWHTWLSLIGRAAENEFTPRSDHVTILDHWPEDILAFSEVMSHGIIISTVEHDTGWPRFWELLRFFLGRRLREQVFEPAFNDLLADHLTTRAVRFQSPWARRWITFCFGARTAWLILECAAVGLRGTVGLFIVPQSVRDAVREWWFNERD